VLYFFGCSLLKVRLLSGLNLGIWFLHNATTTTAQHLLTWSGPHTLGFIPMWEGVVQLLWWCCKSIIFLKFNQLLISSSGWKGSMSKFAYLCEVTRAYILAPFFSFFLLCVCFFFFFFFLRGNLVCLYVHVLTNAYRPYRPQSLKLLPSLRWQLLSFRAPSVFTLCFYDQFGGEFVKRN
jgi:hypothetical protein